MNSSLPSSSHYSLHNNIENSGQHQNSLQYRHKHSAAAAVSRQRYSDNADSLNGTIMTASNMSAATSAYLEDDNAPDMPIFDGPLPTDRFGFLKNNDLTDDEKHNNDEQTSAAISIAKFRKRESKWLEMLGNWPLYMNKQFDTVCFFFNIGVEVRERCRKGIPSSVRGQSWKYLCGAHHYMADPNNRFLFDQLDRHPGDPKWNEDIRKDIYRQFPEHEMFARQSVYGSLGREDLFRLLKAYTVMYPAEGYCQGQAPVAATLLMHMPVRDAFYCFVQVCHKYLNGYYSPGLEAIQMDGRILQRLLKKRARITYKHFKHHGVEPVLYMVEWFMCVFCRTLPWPTVLRIWDMFFCEGVKILFKVAVVLLRFTVGSRAQLKECTDLHSTLEALKHIPANVTQAAFIVQKVVEMDIDEELLERIHYKEVKMKIKDDKQQSASVR